MDKEFIRSVVDTVCGFNIAMVMLITGCISVPSQEHEGHFDNVQPMEFVMPSPIDSPRFNSSIGPGYQIKWRNPGEPRTARVTGADPVDVLRATESKLRSLQSTEFGSDANARALFALAEAIDHLSGTNEVTGTPLPSSELGSER